MTGVAAGSIAPEFSIDAGAAPLRVLQLLQHDDSGPFGEHESVTVDIERPARLLRRVAAKGERPHVLEACQSHRRERGLAAARQHHIGIAVLDGSQRAADRIGGAGAGGRCGDVDSLGPEHRRDVSASRVQQQLRDEEGGDLVDPLRVEPLVLGLELVETAYPRADRHAAAVGVFLGELEPRVGHRIDCRSDGELRESVDPPEFLGVADVLPLCIPRHLAAKLDPIAGHIEQRDRSHAAVATHEAIPESADLSAQRRDDTQPRHHRPPLHAPTCHALSARFIEKPG